MRIVNIIDEFMRRFCVYTSSFLGGFNVSLQPRFHSDIKVAITRKKTQGFWGGISKIAFMKLSINFEILG